MTKIHAGSGKPLGVLNYGTKRQPSPFHGGTNLSKGELRTPQPPVYGTHGGTNLPRVLKRK